MFKKNLGLGLYNYIIILFLHFKCWIFNRNNFTLISMKKLFVIAVSVAFISAIFTSCRSHERCAAYGKIQKIDTGKSISDKTEKSI